MVAALTMVIGIVAATSCTVQPKPSESPPSPTEPTPPTKCDSIGDTEVSNGLATRGRAPDCVDANTCASELLAVREGCVVATWKPDDRNVAITSVSAPDVFSPPMIVVQWEDMHHQGLEVLVLRDDAFVRIQKFGFALPGDNQRTSCSWQFTLPDELGGRANHILALERCETWAPSDPGEPSFAPLTWDKQWLYVWDGTTLTEQSVR